MRRDSGEELHVSGTIRLMQRPLSMQCSKVEGGGASELEHHEEEEEARKGKKERTPEPIYKANG